MEIRIVAKKSDIQDERGRFKKGVSGNPNGRPRGIKSKYSLSRFAEELSKCRGESLEYVKKAMREAEKPADMLKAAVALWTQDKVVQQMMFDQVMNEIKLEDARVALELNKEKLAEKKNKEADNPQEEAEDETPIISFTAHQGGKK